MSMDHYEIARLGLKSHIEAQISRYESWLARTKHRREHAVSIKRSIELFKTTLNTVAQEHA